MITFAPAMKKLTLFIAFFLGWETAQAQLVINELISPTRG